MKSLILIGSGGHCEACIDVIEAQKRFNIDGVIVRELDTAESMMGYPVLGSDNTFPLN